MASTDVVFQNVSNNADARLVAVDDAQRSAVIGRWFFQTAADLFSGADTPTAGPIDKTGPIVGIDRYGNLYQQGVTASDTAATGSTSAGAVVAIPPLLILAGLALLLFR